MKWHMAFQKSGIYRFDFVMCRFCKNFSTDANDFTFYEATLEKPCDVVRECARWMMSSA